MKTYYYYDEVNDDFAGTNFKTKKTKVNYQYLPKSRTFKFFKKCAHIFLVPIVCLCETIILLGVVRNKKVLRKINRKQGYFVYGNHTNMVSDAFSTHTLAFPKETYIIAHQDSLSIKGIGYLVRTLGVLPLPNHYKNYVELIKSIDILIKKGKVISIYPEAHIWPYYTKIRSFPDTSFNFPYRTDAPSFAKTTLYKKGIIRKRRPVIYLDGPFYIDKSLEKKEAINKLRNEIYEAMINRIEKHGSLEHPSYVYKKVDSPEMVHVEISK